MNEVPIPTLDVSAMLAGQPGALESAAEQLRQALEEVGFYYLVGHGVSRALRDSVFDAVERFHAQPLESKLAIRANVHNVGYMPVNGYVSRSSRISWARVSVSSRLNSACWPASVTQGINGWSIRLNDGLLM